MEKFDINISTEHKKSLIVRLKIGVYKELQVRGLLSERETMKLIENENKFAIYKDYIYE